VYKKENPLLGSYTIKFITYIEIDQIKLTLQIMTRGICFIIVINCYVVAIAFLTMTYLT